MVHVRVHAFRAVPVHLSSGDMNQYHPHAMAEDMGLRKVGGTCWQQAVKLGLEATSPSFTPQAVSSFFPPSLPQILLDSWLSHCSHEPGTASEGDRHSLTMADHSCDKFRVSQGCSCSRWEQGSDLAAVVLQLEKRPQRFVCEDGNLMVPGTANKKAAVALPRWRSG